MNKNKAEIYLMPTADGAHERAALENEVDGTIGRLPDGVAARMVVLAFH